MRRRKEKKPIQGCIVDLATDMVDSCLINASCNCPPKSQREKNSYQYVVIFLFE